jgi:V/A-type H+-transporting ATPase subunit I
MFYPQQMTELELVVPERDAPLVTSLLAGQGVFHQLDASGLGTETDLDSADSWRGRANAYAVLERQIVGLMQKLGVDEGLPPAARQVSMVEAEAVRTAVEQLEQATQAVIGDLAGAHDKLEQLERYLHQLEPLAGIDVDISALRQPRHMFSTLGLIPVDKLERLHESLARIPFVLLTLRQDGRMAVVWLAGTRRDADILERAARSAYLNPLNLPEAYRGTPSQVIEALHTGIKRAQQHIAEQKDAVAGLQQTHQQQLQTLLWRVRASRVLADATARFGKLHYTYLVTGWVPSSRLASLIQQLKQASADILIQTNPFQRDSAERSVPVALNNPGILQAFQRLVTMYGQPRYEEMDPTWLVALTFPLLFGAMFGDVGHGLVLAALGGLLASRKVQALRALSSLGPIITTCGLVAAAFGLLYGSLFGLEGVLPALWIRPMENIMQILITAVGAGVVLLSLGFVIGILNAWAARDWGRLLFSPNGLAGLGLYWSLLGLVASLAVKGFPIPPQLWGVCATASGLAVMLSEILSHLVQGHRPLVEGSLGTFIIQAVFELLETLISLLSNSLSYVRVGAFAVAHGGLSAVVFILAGMASPAHGPGYWVVVALGSLFIIGFEGLIVGIQTLRLEYYEFFTKFFTGGGLRYAPLTLPVGVVREPPLP